MVLEAIYEQDFLDRRVRDGVLRCTIDKWLKAGVMEEGAVRYPETGAPLEQTQQQGEIPRADGNIDLGSLEGLHGGPYLEPPGKTAGRAQKELGETHGAGARDLPAWTLARIDPALLTKTDPPTVDRK